MKRGTKPKVKGVRCWAGFVNGAIHYSLDGVCADGLSNLERRASIYKSRRAARKFYTDVRQMELVPIPPKQKRRARKP